MSILEELKTKGDITLSDIKRGDVQYLYSSPVSPKYYLKYKVTREPYMNSKGVWEWVCANTKHGQAFIIFRITPGLDDAPLLFTHKPVNAKRLR